MRLTGMKWLTTAILYGLILLIAWAIAVVFGIPYELALLLSYLWDYSWDNATRMLGRVS